MYTRAWLRSQIESYLKDSNVADHLDTWIDLSSKRVSQLLECFEMEYTVFNNLSSIVSNNVDGGSASSTQTIVIDGGDAFGTDVGSTDTIAMPSEYRRLVQVQWKSNGVWINLRPVGKHEAAPYKRDGNPSRYLIETGEIKPLPFLDGEYRAIFIREVTIPELGDDTDPAVEAYPYIFLNAALAEAYDWKQDPEMNDRYEMKWIREATQVRDLYRSEHVGDTPAMRAV